MDLQYLELPTLVAEIELLKPSLGIRALRAACTASRDGATSG